MSNKKIIRRTDYQKFYEENILRPYWIMISEESDRPNFSDSMYLAFYQYYHNEAWVHAVFTRLAQIYSTFDVDFFPGLVGAEINECMRRHGIKESTPNGN
jgi:hypothetical protein